MQKYNQQPKSLTVEEQIEQLETERVRLLNEIESRDELINRLEWEIIGLEEALGADQ